MLVASLVKGYSFRGSADLRTISLMVVVALCAGLRLLAMFKAVVLLPLGDYSTILSTAPVIVMLLSIPILKEKLSIFRVFAACILLGGVILVARYLLTL